MKVVWIMPAILIIIDLVSATVYFINGDWKRGIYWVSAAVLTASVTF